ncbi:hypothetical protein E1B28_006043 [Marasmius oreades]|uniref:Uncharacterized protein n=1 Tax=Marasmius oreades TaxID=181124 RepID=A0A9P7UVF9_9AGAR|nr:uncharacterized protein E1B28_006043 [Marasmius oreades]KAG7095270.1 hypothetical protein E1B28_006043 [Marasmius oreades]
MGASVSSLAVPYHTSIKEKANVLPCSQLPMISQVQSSSTPQFLQQRQHPHFSSRSSNTIRTTTKGRPALISPVPPVDHDTYSASSKAGFRRPAISSQGDLLLLHSKSKISQDSFPPVLSGSNVYPTVSTLPRLHSTGALNGSDTFPRALKTQSHSLPRHGPISMPDSTQRPSKPSLATTGGNSSNVRAAPVCVDTSETRKRIHQTSETRAVIKSPSWSTMGSSSSSSSGAFSSRDAHRRSSSRLDHEEVGSHLKRRIREDIKLKPIREVEIGGHHIQVNTNKLLSRPPGLGSNRNSAIGTGVQTPATAPAPTTIFPAEIPFLSQTKRLSQILARSSLVVLSPPSRSVDRLGNDEASVKEQDDRQVNFRNVSHLIDVEGVGGAVDNLTDIPEITSTTDADGGKELDEGRAGKFLPLSLYLSDTDRLSSLLQFLSFSDWCSLFNTSKEIRMMISQNELLREEVLERFLREVGYCRWVWREPEPISISLTDMFYYLKNAFTPTHDYVEVAQQFLKSQPNDNEEVPKRVSRLAHATRSYNRLVLRLRAQAEMLEHCDTLSCSGSSSSSSSSSRRSSPYSIPDIAGLTSSFISSSAEHSQQRHHASSPSDSTSFHSPLYRPNRAALLRVFVPSPKGEWLSDDSVLECEDELKRAELTRLMRLGDVIWDIALGDEKGNLGKLIWDGCYLLDLDYTYSSTGDIPRHIPSLAIPPSYFHGIIQRGPLNMDPIVRMDVSPWGEEIARNLQLMQDRMMVETPQGLKNVVRWVHRTTFNIRPPSIRSTSSSGARYWAQTGIPIRDSNGHTVHSAWYGSIVIETDGTSESLDDLKERCGLGVFPQRAVVMGRHGKQRGRHEKMVWRILREKSRPGEIWIRVITPKERLM